MFHRLLAELPLWLMVIPLLPASMRLTVAPVPFFRLSVENTGAPREGGIGVNARMNFSTSGNIGVSSSRRLLPFAFWG